MRKKMKTLVALGLSLSMLTACGSADDTLKESSSQEKSSEQQSQASQSSEQQPESPYPEYLNMDGYRPIVKEGEEVTLKIAIFANSSATTEFEDRWFYNFIEEKLNINLDVEVLSSENVGERTNLMLGSNDLPDMMFNLSIGNDEVVKYGVEEEMFLPLSDYINEELTPNIVEMLAANPEAQAASIAPDGKMYTIPQIMKKSMGNGDTLAQTTTFVDTKYMEAAGITELPVTLDGFIDMLRAFKQLDPATMGVEEIWPMVTVRQLDGIWLQNAFGWVTSNRKTTAVPVWDVYTDQVTIPCLQDRYLDYLTFMNTLYTEGLIHPDYFTMDQETARAMCAGRQAGVCSDYAPGTFNPTEFADYICAAPIKTEWSGEGVATAYTAYNIGDILIAADSEYPELCMRFLDYLYSPEGLVYAAAGAPAGSEDTLGMIEGYSIVDGATHMGSEMDKYPSKIEYLYNEVMFFDYYLNEDLVDKYVWEMVGEEYVDAGTTDINRLNIIETTFDYLEAPLPAVYGDTEVAARFADLQSVIKNHVDAETAKFIVGQRPLSEFAQFQEELKAMGAEEYLEIAQNYYKEYKRAE